MSGRQDFLDAILADPDADAPRLIYADWLDENGDPDRAAFIRHSCYAADESLRMLDRVRSLRVAKALSPHLTAGWEDRLPGLSRAIFERGFVAEVQWYSGADGWVDWMRDEPVMGVCWYAREEPCESRRRAFMSCVAPSAVAPTLADALRPLSELRSSRWRTLDLMVTTEPIDDDATWHIPTHYPETPLEGLNQIPSVRRLSVTNAERAWTSREISALAGMFPNLREVEFQSFAEANQLAEFLDALPDARIETIGVRNHNASVIGQLGEWGGIRHVSRFNIELRDAGQVAAFFGGPHVAALRDIPPLRGDRATPSDWARYLADVTPQRRVAWSSKANEAGPLAKLLTPAVENLSIGLRGRCPANSPLREPMETMRPREVSFSGTGFSGTLLKAWMLGTRGRPPAFDFSRCRSLRLVGMRLSDAVVRAIVECPMLAGLEFLDIAGCETTYEQRIMLANAKTLAGAVVSIGLYYIEPDLLALFGDRACGRNEYLNFGERFGRITTFFAEDIPF